MAKLNLAILSLLATFSLGCDNGKTFFEKDVEKLMASSIQLSCLSTSMLKGTDTVIIFESKPTKMVILFDSTICGSCKVSRIDEYMLIANYAKGMQGKFEPIFIFAPSKDKEHDLRLALRSHPFEWPVFVDTEQKFLKANPHIPKNKALHTFLLDKNNRVVLVGDPIGNDKLWGLYMNTIRELIDNCGILLNDQ